MDPMANRPRSPGFEDRAVAGRTASAAQLRALLAEAPPGFVVDALDNPDLVSDHVVLALRNRSAPAAAIRRIARRHDWLRAYEVKRALVAHPNAPPAVARTYVHHLYWRDLAEVAADLRLHPALRRRAEELLGVRLGELAVGERIALARRVVRGLVAPLAALGEPRVLAALLANPRLVEGDVAHMARGAETPGEVLREIAEHPRWGERLAVRRALLENPRTPVHAALRILDRLPRVDLRRVATHAAIPRVVRLGAARRLGLTP